MKQDTHLDLEACRECKDRLFRRAEDAKAGLGPGVEVGVRGQHPEQEGATGQGPAGVVADLEHAFGVESERLEREVSRGCAW